MQLATSNAAAPDCSPRVPSAIVTSVGSYVGTACRMCHGAAVSTTLTLTARPSPPGLRRPSRPRAQCCR
eukprot:475418-Pyramimonas_sp.AAC.1